MSQLYSSDCPEKMLHFAGVPIVLYFALLFEKRTINYTKLVLILENTC